MTYIIDSHQDMASNALTFGRDYTLSAAEQRRREKGVVPLERTGGEATLGWEDYQRGQVAVVFGTLFAAPARYREGDWEILSYSTPEEHRRSFRQQLDWYDRLCGEHPQMYARITNKRQLKAVLSPWQESPADPPGHTHPVGLFTLWEGPEGLSSPHEVGEWWEPGVRAIGPVWAGTRWCGGSREGEGFTKEGLELLEEMAMAGFGLDVSHMNEVSALTALERYPGVVFASHANARALLKDARNERQLTDATIRRLIERDGVMGVIPFNRFLKSDWQDGDPRGDVTLETLARHIDHVCQMAGNARHAGIGSDLDGGFGWPAIPEEMDTVADLQKLEPILARMGYPPEDIALIFAGNWQRMMEAILPE